LFLIFLTFFSGCQKNIIKFVTIENDHVVFNDDKINHELAKTVEIDEFVRHTVNRKSFKFKFIFDSHGNGVMKTKKQIVKIKDSTDFPDQIKDEYLNIYFKDMNKDGFKDLVFQGILEIMDEEGNKVAKEEEIFEVAYYDKTKNDFILKRPSKLLYEDVK